MSIFGISIGSIGPISISEAPIVILLGIALLLAVSWLVYRSKTAIGFKMRKAAPIAIFQKDMERYKNQVRILFIDDSDVPIIQTLTDENWNVTKKRDVRIDDQKVKEANIIFVDWKGVGLHISAEEEGIALVENLKRRYKHKKYIVLYSAQQYQKPEGTLADDWVQKGSIYSAYVDTIQRGAFCLFY